MARQQDVEVGRERQRRAGQDERRDDRSSRGRSARIQAARTQGREGLGRPRDRDAGDEMACWARHPVNVAISGMLPQAGDAEFATTRSQWRKSISS